MQLLLLPPASDTPVEPTRPCPLPEPALQARGGAPAAAASAGDDHKPRTPPPDLPSLLLDSRIVYLGMPVRLGASFVSAGFFYRVWMGTAILLLRPSGCAAHSRCCVECASACQAQRQAVCLTAAHCPLGSACLAALLYVNSGHAV